MKKLLGLLLCGCIVGVLGLGTPGCGKKKDDKGTVKTTTKTEETTKKDGETVEEKKTEETETKKGGEVIEKKKTETEKKDPGKTDPAKKEPAKTDPAKKDDKKSSRLETRPVFLAWARVTRLDS